MTQPAPAFRLDGKRILITATRARIPLGRIMEPEDIAGPAVFLLSETSSGIALPVDGGITAE